MIGTSLGPYKIIEQLGAGGMGEVYLGEDTSLGRKVAIKGHRHAPQLQRSAPKRHAFRGPRHATLCEQPSRGLASADPTAGTSDAQVQVRRTRAALLVGTRCCPQSLQPRQASIAITQLPVASWSGFYGLDGGSRSLRISELSADDWPGLATASLT